MPEKQIENNFPEMEDNCDLVGEVSVVDVYDIASEIGKECEKIIDQFGAEAVTSLMPKVISALELLENLATKNERENTQLQELRAKIQQLETDKQEKAEYRQRFEKELESIEEQWRIESRELVSVVSKLQDENRRLVKVQGLSQIYDVTTESNSDSDAMLQRLQTVIDKQREELRVKERKLQEKTTECEAQSLGGERLQSCIRELRRKNRSLQNQVRTLCDERADFLVQLQDQKRKIGSLTQRLGLAQKENEDLVKSDSEAPDLTNKAVYDLDDPNRPRFTTQELKDILHERNELKARVSDLEDELECFRPRNKEETYFYELRVSLPNIMTPNIMEELSSQNELVEEDAPVQGPLPYEPDDAPWKKSESGIRKFFRKIFSEGGPNAGNFPRRSLSTLTKMALSSTSEPISV